jgi:uncharacterized cupin superfamily protein
MKKIEQLSENTYYSAVNIGELDDLKNYSLIHPVNKKVIEGKVFLKNATKSSGTEISFNSLPPQSEQPYFHIHKKNEETYIILSGYGFFQVDEDCFSIKEGSVIRVAPQGKRGICNSSDKAMIYLVIQSKENSLEEYTTADGERLSIEPKWRKSK